MNYIDLFAGAGGLSEGFISQGFNGVAHVEIDKYAVETLITRNCYHYLKNVNRVELYYSYINEEITRKRTFRECS